MAKKSKKFSKKEFLSLYENGNYQKVISKAKQFRIDGISEKELHTVLADSYEKLARSNFEKGDVVRALRDIDSLLNIDSDDRYRVLKLKYLCYIERFDDALELGKELASIKGSSSMKKEAVFLYLLARLYSGEYDLDSKMLKSIPASRQKYILGFRELLLGDENMALTYFEESNPRLKIEKANLKALKAIVSGKERGIEEGIKPLYRFLLSGDSRGLPNTKNSRALKHELSPYFEKKRKTGGIKNLLAMKSPVAIDVITAGIRDKTQKNKLIYNNILLLVEKGRYDDALSAFVKHRQQLAELPESAILFISIKSRVEDEKSDRVVFDFFRSYLQMHFKKLAPFQIEHIFFFLIMKIKNIKDAELISGYGQDDLVFLMIEFVNFQQFDKREIGRFEQAVQKYSHIKNEILKLISSTIGLMDEKIYLVDESTMEDMATRITVVLKILNGTKKMHQKYQKVLLDILKNISGFVMNYKFDKKRDIYLLLADTIEQYIERYSIDRVSLPVDMKALFVSINRGDSVKINDPSRALGEEDLIDRELRLLFGDGEMDEYNRYDFDEMEYDLSLVKARFVSAMKKGKDPFAENLGKLVKTHYIGLMYDFIFEMISEAVKFGAYNDMFISRLLYSMNIRITEPLFKDTLIAYANENGDKDPEAVKLFLEYALAGIPERDRERVWYLKWAVGYLSFVGDHILVKGSTFHRTLSYFLEVQKRKNFKSMQSAFKNISERFGDDGKRRTLF